MVIVTVLRRSTVPMPIAITDRAVMYTAVPTIARIRRRVCECHQLVSGWQKAPEWTRGWATRKPVRPATTDPGPRVLILTTFDLDGYVYDALGAGASGFLLKNATAQSLFEAVRVVPVAERSSPPNITPPPYRRVRPSPSNPPIATGCGPQTHRT
jgi:hypothetical protein